MLPSLLPPRPDKPSAYAHARPFVVHEAPPSRPGSAGSRGASDEGGSDRSRSPSPAGAPGGRDGLLSPSASRRRRRDELGAWQEAVQRGRQTWLGEVRGWLRACPQAAHASSFRLRQDDLGLPPLPPKLLAALARAEPAWEQLRLATLVSLLAGPFGDELAATAPPRRVVPAIMVTPPDGEVVDVEVALAVVQSRIGREEARRAEQRAAQAVVERAWLNRMATLLGLPFARTSSPPGATSQVAASTVMPPSLALKLEQAGETWQNLYVGELVELVVALQLVD